MDTGRYTLTFEWPVPVVLQVRPWHDTTTGWTQLSFNCGWQAPPPEVAEFTAKLRRTLQRAEADPAYTQFRAFSGNLVLYSPHSEQLEPTEAFVQQCKDWVNEHYPTWAWHQDWRYAGNELGWTVLISPTDIPE